MPNSRCITKGRAGNREETAWRIYFDKRNAIDLFGKRRPGLYLDLFASPEYVYHQESPFGRDIYGIGKALGVAGIGALVDGKAIPVADVADRKWRVIAAGPVRADAGAWITRAGRSATARWTWRAASRSGPASTASNIASR